MNTRAWALLALVAIGGALIMTTRTPRGIRNNNPGNLRHGPKWDGLRSIQTDSEFSQFETPEAGLRAMGITLLNYEKRHGLRTVRDIANRWAPPIGQDSEGNAYAQDSASYAGYVAAFLGVPVYQPIDVRSRLPELMEAITSYENAGHRYSRPVAEAGVRRALEAVA